MNEERRLLRARTFDEVAELYDHGRRECPVFLIDDLFTLAEIKASEARVLEVGCGTGQAALPLARRGCSIVCVEMGANLARIARRKHTDTLLSARLTVWLASFAYASGSNSYEEPPSDFSLSSDSINKAGERAISPAIIL
jgi:2-polyprenyl-3-methyl-5-hydroxy-6-metoxy-1,4-benzoquinol methylase